MKNVPAREGAGPSLKLGLQLSYDMKAPADRTALASDGYTRAASP